MTAKTENFNLERELKDYPLDEHTRDGCNVCSEGVLDEDTLREAHRTEEPRPKFLESGAVARRKKREYSTAYRTWRKMAGRYRRPVTSPDGYMELGEEEEDDEQKIPLDMMPIETKETEALPEKSYPLTLETKKKHFEKVNLLKKEEKRTALESVQKKREELRKLKDAYKEQAMKIECHKEERKEDYERRKQKYLENLAKQQNVDVNILKTRGDEVYKAYRKECRLWQDMRLEKVRRQEEAVKLLELEGRRQLGSPEEDFRGSGGVGIYREKANIEKVFEEARLALMPREPEQQPELIEEAREEMIEGEALRLHNDSIIGRRIATRSSKLLYKKNKQASSSQSPQSPSVKSKKFKFSPTEPFQYQGEAYPSCRGKDPRNQSELGGELKEAVEEMERTLEEEAELEAKKPERLLRLDHRIVATPTSIHFQEYYPAETKTIKVIMYNTTLKKMYLQFWKIEYEQPSDSKLIQVMPIEIMKVWPGHCRRVEISLTSIAWEKSEELKGKIWFWSCSPPSCKNIRYIVIDVLCSRASPDPHVLNKELNFFDKESWNKKIYKEYLTIENRGSMECRLYIRRESKVPLPVYEELINTVEISDENKPKLKRKPAILKISESYKEVEHLLEEIVGDALSPFRVLLSRGRVLSSFSTVSIPVRFVPSVMDDFCALDKLRVVFEGYASWGREETVLLCGSVRPPLLDVVPYVVDMKTLVIGSRGNQTAFTVRNTTGSFHTIRCKVPANLSKHFHVEPTSILSRPHDENKFVVKSHLGWDFLEDAKDYLNEFNAVLEFSMEVIPEKHTPSKLVVLGTMAHPLGISLEPDAIDFGLVNTTETSVRDIWVINHSMMEHHVAFLNLPQWLLIMPGYGSLKMGPCERRKLQLQYSPTYVQAGKPGGKAEHTFQIKCTTARRLSTLQPNMPLEITEEVKEINEIYNPNDKEEDEIINEGKTDVQKENNTDIQYPEAFLDQYIVPFFLNHTLPETVSSARKKRKDSLTLKGRWLSPGGSSLGSSKIFQNTMSIKKRRDSGADSQEVSFSEAASEPQEEEEVTEPSQEKWIRDHPDIDIPYVTLLGKAVVIDPYSQLSHKKIIFPATPLTSYSIVPIYVSCPSELSGPSCDCGKFVGLQDDPRCRVNARFEFSSDNKYLSIEPASGTLKHGEKIKAYLIFKPKIHGKEVEKLVEEAKKKRTSKRYHKFAKKAVKKLGLSAINHTRRNHTTNNDMALYNSMKQDLLKCTKREVIRVNVNCLIETTFTQEPFDKRTEVLTCQLCCPLIRPDFVIWAPDKHVVPDLEFPATTVGQKSKLHLEIHNINWKTIFLRTSVLDLDNTFYTTIVPPVSSCLPHNIDKGITLVPQDYIKFDVIYEPTHFGKHSGAVVFSANNTIVECKIAGIAKHPQFKLNPVFGFIKMEAKEGQRVIELIKVVNKGVTNIEYRMSTCFEREISKRFIFEWNVQNSIKNKYEPVTNDVVKALIKDFSNKCQKTCPISVEPKELHLKPGATSEFKIIFFPQLNTNQAELKNDNSPPEEYDECDYVKRVVITLGSSTIVADWTILGLVKNKQSTAPSSRKKKTRKMKKTAPSGV